MDSRTALVQRWTMLAALFVTGVMVTGCAFIGTAARGPAGQAFARVVIKIAEEVVVQIGAEFVRSITGLDERDGSPGLEIRHGGGAKATYAVEGVEDISVSRLDGKVSIEGRGGVYKISVEPGSTATIAIDKAAGVKVEARGEEQQPSAEDDGTDWSTKASDHRGRIGARFTYQCPPNGQPGTVWGTDRYTDDSSVCTAAVHAGLISFSSGGAVTIMIEEGAPGYAGSNRRGVSTQDYGSWDGSFRFPRAGPSPPLDATWSTDATQYRGKLGKRLVFRCPPDGTVDDVWGTDLYTDDSSICTAAVHAGLITVSRGGTVAIRIRGGAQQYTGSTRRDVTSNRWNSHPGSFTFE